MNKIKLETRDAIIEAAFQIYNENAGASLGDIADRAGVGRATLHRYFPGRDELMAALAMIALEELEAAIEASAGKAQSYEEYFRLAIQAVVPLANRQWFLSHEAVDADPEVAKAYDASRAEMHAEIEKAKEEGLFDADLPTFWIDEVIENLTYAAWSMVRKGEATPKQAADLAWRTLMNGMKGDM
ncbi:MAG: TetR/AcrR family transcriptional regulator [Pseudomonadota bacterium]